jgi:hypothetical protein
LLALQTLTPGCAASSATVPVSATLTPPTLTGIQVADALEALVATDKASKPDRHYAYDRVKALPVVSAEDALARAMVAGRLAQVSGLSAPGLVAEVEQYARSSAELDPALRSGAARRMLGTLYVMAPASLLQHGDSEVGLELLQDVTRRFPDHVQNHLRLAEGYVALGDINPARPHLCYCKAHHGALRLDENKLLSELLEQAQVSSCP